MMVSMSWKVLSLSVYFVSQCLHSAIPIHLVDYFLLARNLLKFVTRHVTHTALVLLHPHECDIGYCMSAGGCNNVFNSAKAIQRMCKTYCCAMLLHYFEITTRSKQAQVNVES